jgi:probable DNA repair protein
MLEETLVLCANHRLAARWQAHYAADAQKAGKTAWPSPNIYALTHWLLETWQKASSPSQHVIDPLLALWQWREIIDADGQLPSYLQRHRTAELANSAYTTLCQWGLNLDCLSDHPNPDIQKFYAWASHFAAEATQNGTITQAELPNAVAELIQAKRVKIPKYFMLLGFDSLPPSVQALKNSLADIAEEIPEIRPNTQATIKRIECHDSLDEIRCMAHQANAWLEQNPAARIACVVPNLSQLRHKIEEIFNDVVVDFNISAGLCFAHLPMIQTALKILSCIAHPQLNLLHELLLSPYVVASYADRALAGLCLNELNKQGETCALNLSTIGECLMLLARDFKAATLAKRWQALAELPRPKPMASLDEHAQYMEDALLALGWPGQRNPSSFEYQVIERWHRLLLALSLHAQNLNPMPFKKALELLHMMALETVFQGKSEGQAIQILGLLEASGAPCDHLWVMGLHDEAWPPSASPHPFLPIELQRQLGMPHASAQREYEFSLHIQKRLEESATDIIFSSPKTDRERILQPSALIQHVLLIDLNKLLPNYITEKITENYLEILKDDRAPSLTADESLSGGSRILQEQAECPFRAFARARLQARPLEKPSLGLKKVDQGVIVHAVLEKIWQALKTQEILCSKTEDELRHVVRQAVQDTLKSHIHGTGHSHFLVTEMDRVEELVTKWLQFEKTRPFFRVREQETTRYWSLGPVSIRLKIDRIDELEDGSQRLIDYKTGETPSISDWYKPDCRYTQLPLYCLQNPTTIQSIAYAKVNALKPELRGIDCETEIIHQWQTRIDQLSRDFCQGQAQPEPIEASICQRCELNPLCRREIFA